MSFNLTIDRNPIRFSLSFVELITYRILICVDDSFAILQLFYYNKTAFLKKKQDKNLYVLIFQSETLKHKRKKSGF